MKRFTCHCYHSTDVLVELSKKNTFPAPVRCLHLRHPSMFTNVCTHYYAHVHVYWSNKCQISFHLLKSSKNPPLHCQQLKPANLTVCLWRISSTSNKKNRIVFSIGSDLQQPPSIRGVGHKIQCLLTTK